MRQAIFAAILMCAGCPQPATRGPIPAADMQIEQPADALIDTEPSDMNLDATPIDAALDAAPVVDAAPYDPCVASEQRPHLALGPSGGAAFEGWTDDAEIPLIRLAQGGSVTRFDLLAVDVDAAAEGLTVTVVDLDTEQELAFGETRALELPCRPGVGRLLVDRSIDYVADFAATDLIGRRVRIVATLHTAAGDVFGGAEGVLLAAR